MLKNQHTDRVTFTAPKVESMEYYHLILQVSDGGSPALTRYKRIILEVNP